MANILIHPGDNGAQEFYEAADGSWLVFRNHGSSPWYVLQDGQPVADRQAQAKPGQFVVLVDDDLKRVLRRVKKQCRVTLRIDRSRRYEGRGRGKMRLVAADSTTPSGGDEPR